MKTKGRRQSTNVSSTKSARAKHIHTSGSYQGFAQNYVDSYIYPKGPTDKQIALNKKLGSGMPNARSLKQGRVKKRGR